MITDIVMIALVLAGLGLTITYFYVAVALWRQDARQAVDKDAAQRKLHGERIRAASPASGRHLVAEQNMRQSPPPKSRQSHDLCYPKG